MFFSFLFNPIFLILVLPITFYGFPYLKRWYLKDIPGPPLAALSNIWLMYQCRLGRRYKAVDDAHMKYGTFVRIQPNHVSVADSEAIPIVYGHGNGFLKAYVQVSPPVRNRLT